MGRSVGLVGPCHQLMDEPKHPHITLLTKPTVLNGKYLTKQLSWCKLLLKRKQYLVTCCGNYIHRNIFFFKSSSCKDEE